LSGQVDQALTTMDEALLFCEGRLASSYVPMMMKLRGDILASRGDRDGAEKHYRQSLTTVRQQGAKLYELQIGLALARLLHGAERQADARILLAPIVDSFTEGFDLVDFKAGRSLLEESC
jgi:predicted negative regulator of RcsB-dependent stress response